MDAASARKGFLAGVRREEIAGKVRDAARARVIDLSALPLEVRRLAVAGYASVALLLGVVLLFEWLGPATPVVMIRDAFQEVRVSLPAAGVASGAFALGWAFLLTGAFRCSLWVVLPVLGLFLVEWVAFLAGAPPAILLPLGAAGLLIARIARRNRDRDGRTLPQFLGWLVFLGGCTLLAWRAGTPAETVNMLDSGMTVLFVLLYPFMTLLGLELVDAGINLAGGAVGWLRRRLSDRALRVIPLLLVFVLWTGALLLAGFWGWSVPASVLAITAGGTALLLIPALFLRLARRWTARAAALVLGLSIALLPLAYGLDMSLQRADALQAAAGPPVFLFAVMLAYNTLNFGRRFAERDSPALPRPGRVLVYFGSILLLLSYGLLRLNTRDVDTGQIDRALHEIVNALFFAGVLFLGPLYLGWVAWKRRERLIGNRSA